MANKNSPLKDFHQINTKEEKLIFQKAVEAIYQAKGKLPDKWFWVKENNIYFYVEQNTKKRRKSILKFCEICDRNFVVRLAQDNSYCSPECVKQSKKNKLLLSCSFCKKTVFKTKSRYEKSRSGLAFCNKECKDNAAKLEGGIKEIWPEHFGKAKEHSCKKRSFWTRSYKNLKIDNISEDFSYVYFSDCKKCKKPFTKKHSSICYCPSCTLEYTTIYRKACKFNLNNRDHAHLYNSDLIKKYGFYAPKNSSQPNLNGLSWDHLFRVEEGFKLSIPPEIMNHPANAELIPHGINQKRRKSMISYDELVLRIQEYDKGNLNLNYFFKDTYESN